MPARYLTDEEIALVNKSFTGKFAERNRAIFHVGIFTGFRANELCSIELKDVWNGSEVMKKIKLDRSKMKGKLQARTVDTNPILRELLKAYILSFKPETYPSVDGRKYLFPSQKGGRLLANTYGHIIKKAFMCLPDHQQHGIVSSHSMRKTFAKSCQKILEYDYHSIQKMMGHRYLESTMCYLASQSEKVEEAFDKIAYNVDFLL